MLRCSSTTPSSRVRHCASTARCGRTRNSRTVPRTRSAAACADPTVWHHACNGEAGVLVVARGSSGPHCEAGRAPARGRHEGSAPRSSPVGRHPQVGRALADQPVLRTSRATQHQRSLQRLLNERSEVTEWVRSRYCKGARSIARTWPANARLRNPLRFLPDRERAAPLPSPRRHAPRILPRGPCAGLKCFRPL